MWWLLGCGIECGCCGVKATSYGSFIERVEFMVMSLDEIEETSCFVNNFFLLGTFEPI